MLLIVAGAAILTTVVWAYLTRDEEDRGGEDGYE
jgi:hypothetical protein